MQIDRAIDQNRKYQINRTIKTDKDDGSIYGKDWLGASGIIGSNYSRDQSHHHQDMNFNYFQQARVLIDMLKQDPRFHV
jgi:hypothetical protein